MNYIVVILIITLVAILSIYSSTLVNQHESTSTIAQEPEAHEIVQKEPQAMLQINVSPQDALNKPLLESSNQQIASPQDALNELLLESSNQQTEQPMQPRHTLQMTLRGDTGEEEMIVKANGIELTRTIVSVIPETKIFGFENTINTLEITFTNDGKTSQGIDRNIRLSLLEYDGMDLLPVVNTIPGLEHRVDMMRQGILAWGRTYTYPITNTVSSKIEGFNSVPLYFSR